MTVMLRVEEIAKTFTLHNQGGTRLPVFSGVSFQVMQGDALVLAGPSGSGKSTLLRLLYANYRPTSGRVFVRHLGKMRDIVKESPHVVLDIRRRTLGYVSQFLRVIPRITTLEVIKDPMLARGVSDEEATKRARVMLERLNLSERLWNLGPATFSGGEQQRVNIARSFVDPAPLLLLDEPTASLDAINRDVVVSIINEARQQGIAIVGIFHDEAVRDAIATRSLEMASFKERLAA